MHADDNKRDILVLCGGPRQGLDGTTITAEAKYSIKFSRLGIKFCLSLHYKGNNIFLFANAIKIYQFKVNSSDHFV